MHAHTVRRPSHPFTFRSITLMIANRVVHGSHMVENHTLYKLCLAVWVRQTSGKVKRRGMKQTLGTLFCIIGEQKVENIYYPSVQAGPPRAIDVGRIQSIQ